MLEKMRDSLKPMCCLRAPKLNDAESIGAVLMATGSAAPTSRPHHDPEEGANISAMHCDARLTEVTECYELLGIVTVKSHSDGNWLMHKFVSW
jgi:hypothetical protein